jgi:hypothetical protein
MKYRFWVFTGILTLLLIISVSFNITLAVGNETPEPGSEQDPLVSKSYVDDTVGKQVQGLQAKLDTALADKLDVIMQENAFLKQRLDTQDQTLKALQKEVETLKAKGTGSTAPAGTKPSGTKPAGTTSKGVVNATSLNIRATPSTTAALAGKAVKGEAVDITAKQGEWVKVKTSKGIVGWVMAQYITVK